MRAVWLVVLALAPCLAQADFSGRVVHVQDGDTLTVLVDKRQVKVRLDAIDAPELKQYMLISLNGTYYHYCRIGAPVVAQLLQADSMGRYYNGNIKGRFDCRQGGIPG